MKLPMDADAEYIEKKRPRRIVTKPRKQEEFKSAVREALADISDLSVSQPSMSSDRSLNGARTT